jgi:hypothetical protein
LFAALRAAAKFSLVKLREKLRAAARFSRRKKHERAVQLRTHAG